MRRATLTRPSPCLGECFYLVFHLIFNKFFFSITDTEQLDRHPERRLKAAYTAFEEKHLPRLKAENSNLRLSQLKQMLKKDWLKSPENPLNQRSLAYNAKA